MYFETLDQLPEALARAGVEAPLLVVSRSAYEDSGAQAKIEPLLAGRRFEVLRPLEAESQNTMPYHVQNRGLIVSDLDSIPPFWHASQV